MSREGELEIEAEIEQIRSLPIDEIRALWQQTFKSQPPPALGKDMLGRTISYHIQEKRLGGLTRAALRLLDDIGRGKPAVETARRRLKPGTVLVREYQGERHSVGASLQRLLDDVRSGKIDIIVVYKVDRLTRSLADFAKLVELFDQYGVSFVSITQSFNTTSSMGRLTLNVLLSFAQFEREVIGERVRDKIAASKRKGLWVGGPVPLGYATDGKKLLVMQAEAKIVRTIFALYLEVGSITVLAEILERKGIRTKVRPLANGETRGGMPFGVGALAHLLRNRFYVGEIDYRGEVHAGEHEAILDRSVFDKVQAKLKKNAVDRAIRLKGSPALLMGRIFDDSGNRMTPSHSNKGGVRYRYYVSHALIQGRRHQSGSVSRVPAVEIEDLVLQAVRQDLSSRIPENVPLEQDVIVARIDKIIVKREAIEIKLLETEPTSTSAGPGKRKSKEAETANSNTIWVPWTTPAFVAVKGIVHALPENGPTLTSDTRDTLLNAIAKARHWIDDITSGRAKSFAYIAKNEKKVERHIRLLAPLAFVAPSIVHSIIEGTAPANLTVTELAKSSVHSWRQQHHLLKVSRKR
jgi:DNA invertase Pin-like site-specific DNA recombinase